MRRPKTWVLRTMARTEVQFRILLPSHKTFTTWLETTCQYSVACPHGRHTTPLDSPVLTNAATWTSSATTLITTRSPTSSRTRLPWSWGQMTNTTHSHPRWRLSLLLTLAPARLTSAPTRSSSAASSSEAPLSKLRTGAKWQCYKMAHGMASRIHECWTALTRTSSPHNRSPGNTTSCGSCARTR